MVRLLRFVAPLVVLTGLVAMPVSASSGSAGQSWFGQVSGILVALVALILPFGVRWLRNR